ncbi:hypothetical protein QJS04_geneDACA022382 [Acorus gramineus]|uniref:Uncharacterized protein n=1 Tax=Acorus gramineus TaxID=55184 RepID=A0AAV9B0B7_ACOGR|nr:hypothetical protein QJS04_geneDACA022382 [Acorus gramineus]
MGESLLTSLTMENNSISSNNNNNNHHHHPSTLLSMDPSGGDCDRDALSRQIVLPRPPPDINLPLSSSPPTTPWNPNLDPCDLLDVGLGPQLYETDTLLNLPSLPSPVPVPANASAAAIASGVPDVFMVQHDMENMYMWVFKERPENALGKMQLRSYMNGHSRPGEPQFPFSVERGFVRSHRMQRKQYRGLSNPQCVHGIEVVRSPNLGGVTELDRKRWAELTGREVNFSILTEASDFGSWRNLPNMEFELERPPPTQPPTSKGATSLNSRRLLLNGSGLNLSTQPSNSGADNGMDLSPVCSKRRKDFFSHGGVMDEEFVCLPSSNLYPSDRGVQDMDIHPIEPAWSNDFTGVMRHTYGPVTAAKTIYEDEEGYLIMVSLPFSDPQRVKVSWRNTLTRGIVKILCFSTARMPYIKRHDRTFKLTDPSPEHCPPGEFVREIPLATRIPEDAKLEAYYDETGTVLEIMVPKHRVGPEEHEVRVCLRPHLGANELLLT